MGCPQSCPDAGVAVTQEHMQGHVVKLAITPLGSRMPAMPEAYHTSVVVDDVEFAFSPNGVKAGRDFASHRAALVGGSGNRYGPGFVLELGVSSISGADMARALRPFFRPGTYDLLRKNCNAFSDVALFYLLGRRLDGQYAALERIAAKADDALGVVQILLSYTPNPKALGFDKNEIIERCWALTGHSPLARSVVF
mmetsp:Transcript_2598/g.5527  ORF Transcript_2598/g.5527 Transcript_2598/m.5527 type:complete len:196 (-) Transcript_2598:246-833(-)